MRPRRYEGRPALILAVHPWRWPFVTRLDLGDTLEARAHREGLVYVPVAREFADATGLRRKMIVSLLGYEFVPHPNPLLREMIHCTEDPSAAGEP